MALGFFIAQDRKAKDPIIPALIGGVLPLPLGPVAAALLTDTRSATVAAATAPPAPRPAPPPPPDAKEQPKVVVDAIHRAEELLKEQGSKYVATALKLAASVHELLPQYADDQRQLIANELHTLLSFANEAAGNGAQHRPG